MLRTIETLCGKHRIEYLVSRLILRLVLHILILQHTLYRFEFLSHAQFATLDQMRIQDRDSSASAAPISSPNFSSQLFATDAAVGKHVAGSEAFRPKWSPAPACLRNPCGPSDIVIDGIPYFSKSTVCHVFFPDIINAFSSRVILLMIDSYFKLIIKTCLFLMIAF